MKKEQLGNITLYNADCKEVMKTFADKQFDLAICDPNYGIGASRPSVKPELVKQENGSYLKVKRSNIHKSKSWDDSSAGADYFDELFRISKHQIIFGVNYYDYPLKGGRLVWDKMNGDSDQMDCEIAYVSLNNRTDLVRFLWAGMFQGKYCGKDAFKASIQQGNKKLNEIRIHPTQKPVALYSWMLDHYAQEGQSIIDTHSGSLSLGIACHDLGFDLTAIELDPEYYLDAKNRLFIHQNTTINFKKTF